jgi:hypothetical protein
MVVLHHQGDYLLVVLGLVLLGLVLVLGLLVLVVLLLVLLVILVAAEVAAYYHQTAVLHQDADRLVAPLPHPAPDSYCQGRRQRRDRGQQSRGQ